MSASWKRVEPGFYELRGTTLAIANMKGQSVKWSGLVVDPWQVRLNGRVVAEVATMAEAKAEAIRRTGEPEARLTPPQAAMLRQVRAAGQKVYNGRARRTIAALESAGLVSVDWDMRPQAKGSGMELTEKITVRPADSPLKPDPVWGPGPLRTSAPDFDPNP